MAYAQRGMVVGDAVGKAIPYGVYDVASNAGFVSVGIDHDTPVFAATGVSEFPCLSAG